MSNEAVCLLMLSDVYLVEAFEMFEEGKKDNGLGFVEDDAKKLNVKVYKDEVDKLIKEYKKIKKARKSNLGQVKLLDKHGKPLK